MSRHIRLLDKYDAEIVEEKYNLLVERYEVLLRVIHIGEGSPSRGLMKQAIAKIYRVDPGLVYIRKIETSYGFPQTIIEAHVYRDQGRARLFEPEYVVKRDEESLGKTITQ